MSTIKTAPLVRGGWGLGAGVVAKVLGAWVQEYPVFALLGTTSLGFVASAALFGWPGLAGTAAAHVLYAVWRGSTFAYVVSSTLAYATAGALVYVVFRRVSGTGRSLADLRSFRWYAAASGFGAVLTSGVISVAFQAHRLPEILGVWARSTVVSVWVFGPPLLMAGWWFLRGWLVPIPGERRPAERRRYSLGDRDGGSGRVQIVERPEPALRRSLVVGAGLILGVTVLALAVGRAVEAAAYWLSLLYLFPLYWAAQRHRLAGGLVAAAGVSLAFMGVQSFEQSRLAAPTQTEELQIYAQILVFLAVGVLLGAARNRETELLEELAAGNRRLRGDLQRVVRALTGAVRAKDLYTEGHLRRVSAFALEVGRRLGLGSGELELLQIASTLHDVGKIGIPEHILNKPAPLAPQERRIVERHPEIGARILEHVEGLEAAAPLVLHHQERFDGRRDERFPGYPAGLTGDAIPLGARIIAVVDAFDAMTTDRAYRKARSQERAAEILRAERGRQFDPRVVDVFLELLGQRSWEEPEAGALTA